MTDNKNIKDYLHLYLGCGIWSDAIQEHVGTLYGIFGNKIHLKVRGVDYTPTIGQYKPILRQLSDITEEEKNWFGWDRETWDYTINKMSYKTYHFHGDELLYLLSKHFDLFGLIDNGLAIDKTKLEK